MRPQVVFTVCIACVALYLFSRNIRIPPCDVIKSPFFDSAVEGKIVTAEQAEELRSLFVRHFHCNLPSKKSVVELTGETQGVREPVAEKLQKESEESVERPRSDLKVRILVGFGALLILIAIIFLLSVSWQFYGVGLVFFGSILLWILSIGYIFYLWKRESFFWGSMISVFSICQFPVITYSYASWKRKLAAPGAEEKYRILSSALVLFAGMIHFTVTPVHYVFAPIIVAELVIVCTVIEKRWNVMANFEGDVRHSFQFHMFIYSMLGSWLLNLSVLLFGSAPLRKIIGEMNTHGYDAFFLWPGLVGATCLMGALYQSNIRRHMKWFWFAFVFQLLGTITTIVTNDCGLGFALGMMEFPLKVFFELLGSNLEFPDQYPIDARMRRNVALVGLLHGLVYPVLVLVAAWHLFRGHQFVFSGVFAHMSVVGMMMVLRWFMVAVGHPEWRTWPFYYGRCNQLLRFVWATVVFLFVPNLELVFSIAIGGRVLIRPVEEQLQQMHSLDSSGIQLLIGSSILFFSVMWKRFSAIRGVVALGLRSPIFSESYDIVERVILMERGAPGGFSRFLELIPWGCGVLIPDSLASLSVDFALSFAVFGAFLVGESLKTVSEDPDRDGRSGILSAVFVGWKMQIMLFSLPLIDPALPRWFCLIAIAVGAFGFVGLPAMTRRVFGRVLGPIPVLFRVLTLCSVIGAEILVVVGAHTLSLSGSRWAEWLGLFAGDWGSLVLAACISAQNEDWRLYLLDNNLIVDLCVVCGTFCSAALIWFAPSGYLALVFAFLVLILCDESLRKALHMERWFATFFALMYALVCVALGTSWMERPGPNYSFWLLLGFVPITQALLGVGKLGLDPPFRVTLLGAFTISVCWLDRVVLLPCVGAGMVFLVNEGFKGLRGEYDRSVYCALELVISFFLFSLGGSLETPRGDGLWILAVYMLVGCISLYRKTYCRREDRVFAKMIYTGAIIALCLASLGTQNVFHRPFHAFGITNVLQSLSGPLISLGSVVVIAQAHNVSWFGPALRWNDLCQQWVWIGTDIIISYVALGDAAAAGGFARFVYMALIQVFLYSLVWHIPFMHDMIGYKYNEIVTACEAGCERIRRVNVRRAEDVAVELVPAILQVDPILAARRDLVEEQVIAAAIAEAENDPGEFVLDLEYFPNEIARRLNNLLKTVEVRRCIDRTFLILLVVEVIARMCWIPTPGSDPLKPSWFFAVEPVTAVGFCYCIIRQVIDRQGSTWWALIYSFVLFLLSLLTFNIFLIVAIFGASLSVIVLCRDFLFKGGRVLALPVVLFAIGVFVVFLGQHTDNYVNVSVLVRSLVAERLLLIRSAWFFAHPLIKRIVSLPSSFAVFLAEIPARQQVATLVAAFMGFFAYFWYFSRPEQPPVQHDHDQ